MSMIVNHNIPALSTYNVVNATSNALSKSIKKLSTGLRINSAADDAAGLAISEKMRAQISGLSKASENAQDGISMLQTAEGALTETHSILQRMRELSVQAANDTLTAQDRSYIQLEIDELRDEITNIGNTTQFNTKKLLNGDAAVLWSADDNNTKAIINGGLRKIDQFGQKKSNEANYKISIKATPGEAQVQKTDIMKIKHQGVVVEGEPMAAANSTGTSSGVEYLNQIKIADPLTTMSTITANATSGTVILGSTTYNVSLAAAAGNDINALAGAIRDAANGTDKVGDIADVQVNGNDIIITLDDTTTAVSMSASVTENSHAVNSTTTSKSTSELTLTDLATTDCINALKNGGKGSITLDVNGTATTYEFSAAGDISTAANLKAAMLTGVSTADNTTTLSSALGALTNVTLDVQIDGDNFVVSAVTTDPATNTTEVTNITAGTVKSASALDFGLTSQQITDMAANCSSDTTITVTDGVNSVDVVVAAEDMKAAAGAGTYAAALTAIATEITNAIGNTTDTNGLLTGVTAAVNANNDGIVLMDTEGNTLSGTMPVSGGNIGDTASKLTKLRDIDKFWTSEGVFMLEDPQTITITQGDGKQTSITIYGTDTIGDVETKLNDAIGKDVSEGGLGQDAYLADPDLKFATFVSKADAITPNPIEADSVAGTFVIRSAVAGAAGELNFSADENLLNALSLNEIHASSETRYTVTVTDAHDANNVIAENVEITGNKLVGVIDENIDVQFDSMLGAHIKAENDNGYFKLTDDNQYTTYLHLSDNTTVFQVGANEGEDMLVNLGDMRATALGLDKVLVTDRDSAARSITVIDDAIDKVSTQRAKIGAYQNRLEYKISNLTTAYENMTSAESRIRDTDMAKEMMNFMKLQINLQAGTAMLSQANQLTQNVLSLIR